MPFFAFTGIYGPNPSRPWRAWIPRDDETVVVLGVQFHPLRPLTDAERTYELTRSSVSNIAPELRPLARASRHERPGDHRRAQASAHCGERTA
jgi:hypothetical protein